ncbi:MAG TPA: folylpolyglutamate synthase/dihydrofolate synthase family protein [Chryseosolibacter sp.]|nr:folylpolyglutamate synthase/dihydrofolate synthase family protein [Chryseosolibacter sp.]
MVVRNYQEAIDYLYQNLPMFQRVGAAALKPDLSNTIALCGILGNPQAKFSSIHVAGTNGKGSTSHMLASVLQSSGYKTGLYTSPHLKRFTERIRINGEEIHEDFVIDFINRTHLAIERVKPSFFEMTVAMAFDYFASEGVDMAVIEVGLGGRLDSTNVIDPVLSVITNIGWDHKDLLGDTLVAIASEKAGIIKQGTPVVVSERQGDVQEVFIAKASREGAPLVFASDHYSASVREKNNGVTWSVSHDGKPFMKDLQIPLHGLYQRKNVPGVIQAVEVLRKVGFSITNEELRHGLEHVISQTNLKGRWQILGDAPRVICDTGHNVDGIREVMYQIRQQKFRELHMVWGMVKEKEVSAVFSILPKGATYYFCEAKIPRAMPASGLHEYATAAGLRGVVIPDVNNALKAALRAASPDDLIFVGGSTFVVAEIEGL